MRTHPAALTHAVIGVGASLLLSCGGSGYGGGGGSRPPASLTISITPSTITLGESATITWSSNAPSCTASGAWSGNKDNSGSESVMPAEAGAFTYTLVCSGGRYGASDAGSATLMVDAAPLTGLWLGEVCCVESQPFQVTGLTSDSGDYRFMLLGTHYVGGTGKAQVAYATCDSCLAGKATTDMHDYRLLGITPRGTVRQSIKTRGSSSQPRIVEFSVPRSHASGQPAGVAAIQGIYTTNLGTGYTLTIGVDGSGLVAGTDTNGCSLHGRASTRHRTVNEFDLALDVSACGDSNGRYDGKAALISDSTGRARELFLSASNAGAAIGWRLSR